MMDRYTTQPQVSLAKTARFLALIWVGLSFADAVVTYFCLQNIANVEGNPLARALLSQHEVIFYGAKALVTIGIGVGFWWLSARTRHLKPMIACQAMLIVLFVLVVANNMAHL
jgi:hypothetical protein